MPALSGPLRQVFTCVALIVLLVCAVGVRSGPATGQETGQITEQRTEQATEQVTGQAAGLSAGQTAQTEELLQAAAGRSEPPERTKSPVGAQQKQVASAAGEDDASSPNLQEAGPPPREGAVPQDEAVAEKQATGKRESLIERLRRQTGRAVPNGAARRSGAEKNGVRLQRVLKDKASRARREPSTLHGKSDSMDSIQLFGTVAFRGPLKALPKWTRVLRFVEARGGSLTSVFGAAKSHSAQKAWKAFARESSKLGVMEQLRRVNAYFNKWPYRLDMEVFGVSDYWATPVEFVATSGDCEDYAIVKYFALKELGIAPRNMRIVVLYDRIRSIGHAALVVYHDGRAWVLDNQTNLVFQHTKYAHYVPQYSVNETNRWAHVPARKMQ